MECPHCRLFSPPGALRCDCGYDFASQSMQGAPLRLASLSARFIGQILDGLVAFMIFFVPTLAFRFLGAPAILSWFPVMCLILAILYLLFSDGFSNGQSYGKRVVKTAVVDAATGLPCTFGKSFLRNLLLDFLGPIDWIFVFGAKRQRLGDKAANTIVIDLS